VRVLLVFGLMICARCAPRHAMLEYFSDLLILSV